MRQKQMPRTANLKRRKGKCTVALSSQEARGSHKVSVKRRGVKRAKMEMDDTKKEMPQSDSLVGFCREKTDCRSPPPTPEESEGKENKVRTRPDLDPCRTNGVPEKMEGEDAVGESVVEVDKSIFADDDSNQILPVEQFFGNLEVVQDCPRRSSTSSAWSRREHRRRHYYAKEDSDEEGRSDEESGTEIDEVDEGGS